MNAKTSLGTVVTAVIFGKARFAKGGMNHTSIN